MTKNEALINQFEKTIANLGEVLAKLEDAKDERAIFRDSAIQRFEIAFDVCWKTIKEKLREKYGVDCASPKKCFQEAFKQGIIGNDVIWLDLTDMRNETAHAYNETFAETVLAKLPEALKTFESLLWKLKQ